VLFFSDLLVRFAFKKQQLPSDLPLFQIRFKVEQAPKAALKQASPCAMRAHVSVHVHQAEIH
jgi:hypothetical protein